MNIMEEFLIRVTNNFGSYYSYIVMVVIIVSSLGIMIIRGNLLQKMIGLSLLQSASFLFFISLGYIRDKFTPIISGDLIQGTYLDFVNPLPQAIVLTAIVVGLATTAVGCCLVIRIKEDLHSIEEDELYNIGRVNE